tara:strand:+ start:239 stop:520 length:282 start_codon:yes stop_codon:yes gene_type:complete
MKKNKTLLKSNHCLNLISYGRVDLNGALNRKNYGNRRMGNTGICVWTDSIYSGSKTYKQTKRKRNSRRELQGRLMHQTNQFNHGRVSLIGLSF